MKNILYSFATVRDAPEMKALLKENSLPYEDIDLHIAHFIVAKESETLIGIVGLELLIPFSLLRSLVVKKEFQNAGIANELLKRISEYAVSGKVRDLYLLTTTAEKYFLRKGFLLLDRKNLPDAVRKTQEFISLCPDTAVCLHKKIII